MPAGSALPSVRSLLPHRLAGVAPPPIAATLAAVALLVVALGGCGSSSSGKTAASPATVTPASAPLYVEAVVQPSGTLKTDTESAAHTLTGRPHPFEGLLKLLAAPTASGGQAGRVPSYTQEVKPWLGTHAGLFLSSIGAPTLEEALRETLTKGLSEGFSGAEAALLGPGGLLNPSAIGQHAVQGALVLDTTDVAKARAFLEAQENSAGAHTTSYRGVSYQVAGDGVAEGIVHNFAVIGSEAGVKNVIDTALGGPALPQAPAYAKLAATAEPNAIANLYLQQQALATAVTTSGSGESVLPLLRGLLGTSGDAYLSLIPTASTVALDVDTLSTGAESQPTTGEGSGTTTHTTGAEVLRGLPGGSWLAIGIGDLGNEVGDSPQGLRALASLLSGLRIGSFSLEKALAPLSSHALDARRDLLSWMGPTGIFVSGANLIELRAAVVIDSKDPAGSLAALGKFAVAYREAGGQVSSTSIPGMQAAETVKLPNFPLPVTLAAGQGKFVIGISSASVEEALHPQSTLAGTSAYDAAAGALGQGIQPSALVEFRTLLGLIESLGLNQAPGFSGAASALQPLDTLAAGGGATVGSSGVKRARLVLGLQAAG
jgi:Protein of unknown function (DUF3352)